MTHFKNILINFQTDISDINILTTPILGETLKEYIGLNLMFHSAFLQHLIILINYTGILLKLYLKQLRIRIYLANPN